jgi:predicted HAD superfamily phosphohydrolase YqeG
MINQAKKKWKLKKSEIIMMGDKKTDKLASKRAGIKFVYKKKISLYKQIKNIL